MTDNAYIIRQYKKDKFIFKIIENDIKIYFSGTYMAVVCIR